MEYLLSAFGGAFVYWLIDFLRKEKKLPIPFMSDSDFEPALEAAGVEGSERPHSLLDEVILYIISRSSSKKFTKHKLEAYLIIASQVAPLGVDVTRDASGVHIAGMGRYIRNLSVIGAISVKRAPPPSDGRHFLYKVRTEIQEALIPSEVRQCIDFLISEWDGKPVKGLLPLLNHTENFMENFNARHTDGSKPEPRSKAL